MADFVPYGQFDQHAINCIAKSAAKHGVPEALLHAVAKKEGGSLGKCVRNTNGTLDCGPAQINTSWAKEFSRYNVDFASVTHDACTNFDASGFILRRNFELKQDWFKTIVSYNIGPAKWTPNRYAIGYKYASDVVKYWWDFEKRRISQGGSGQGGAIARSSTSSQALAPQPVTENKPKAKPNRFGIKQPYFYEVADSTDN